MRDHNEDFQDSDHRERPNLSPWSDDYFEDNQERPCDGSTIDAQ